MGSREIQIWSPGAPRGAHNDARKGPKPKKTKTQHTRIFLPVSCCPCRRHFPVVFDFGGLFGIPRGRPARIGAPPEPRKRVRNRARDTLRAPARVSGPFWVDLGSIWGRFWVDSPLLIPIAQCPVPCAHYHVPIAHCSLLITHCPLHHPFDKGCLGVDFPNQADWQGGALHFRGQRSGKP